MTAEIRVSKIIPGPSIIEVDPGDKLMSSHSVARPLPISVFPKKIAVEDGKTFEFYLPHLGIHTKDWRFRVITSDKETVITINPHSMLKDPSSVFEEKIGPSHDNSHYEFSGECRKLMSVRHL